MKAKLVLSLLISLTAVRLSAQISSASLTGLITDPSNAVVAGAKVTVRSQTTNLERSTQTDSSVLDRAEAGSCEAGTIC